MGAAAAGWEEGAARAKAALAVAREVEAGMAEGGAWAEKAETVADWGCGGHSW